MKKRRRVGEPVQVYLDAAERERLERLAWALGKTKSDVLREALEALELHVLDPSAHPALQIIGLADRERAGGPGYDVSAGARSVPRRPRGGGLGDPADAAPWALRLRRIGLGRLLARELRAEGPASVCPPSNPIHNAHSP